MKTKKPLYAFKIKAEEEGNIKKLLTLIEYKDLEIFIRVRFIVADSNENAIL